MPVCITELITLLESAYKAELILESTYNNARVWLEAGFLPNWALESFEALFAREAWTELNDRFYTTIALGTGGMRGRTLAKMLTKAEAGPLWVAGATPKHAGVGSAMLNDFNVQRATAALFEYTQTFLKDALRDEIPRLVIAHDVRHFSAHFARLAAQVWMQLGGHSYVFEGPRSTPQLSFTVRALSCHAGVVITASHNPAHDNGYKIYFEDGAQATAEHAQGIMHAFNNFDLHALCTPIHTALAPDKVNQAAEALYLQMLQGVILDRIVLATYPPKLVYTPVHGTGQVMTVAALKALGIEPLLVPLQMDMDPNFATVPSPNPEHAAVFALGIELAKQQHGDAVLATDPDADRMGAAVRTIHGVFEVLSGNVIAAALLAYRIAQLKLFGWIPYEGSQRAVVIKTFVTSPFLDAIAQAEGLRVVNTLTGFKYIGQKLELYEQVLRQKLHAQGKTLRDLNSEQDRAQAMLELSTYCVFGAEESYGCLACDAVRDKDANMAVVLFTQLLAHIKALGQTFDQYLDALYLKYGYYAESVLNISYEGAQGAHQIKRILESYRTWAPVDMAQRKVLKIEDFERETIVDSDGQRVPIEAFFLVELEGGYSYALRASGTEPKVKFYLFAHETAYDMHSLEQAKAQACLELNKLKEALDLDARKRAQQPI